MIQLRDEQYRAILGVLEAARSCDTSNIEFARQHNMKLGGWNAPARRLHESLVKLDEVEIRQKSLTEAHQQADAAAANPAPVRKEESTA